MTICDDESAQCAALWPGLYRPPGMARSTGAGVGARSSRGVPPPRPPPPSREGSKTSNEEDLEPSTDGKTSLTVQSSNYGGVLAAASEAVQENYSDSDSIETEEEEDAKEELDLLEKHHEEPDDYQPPLALAHPPSKLYQLSSLGQSNLWWDSFEEPDFGLELGGEGRV